ncbi:flavocytochrome c [Desulfitobacterium sp. THU1]|uniref:flavocytochrome c n=1 Tax=Desulfitobacterium sp. THU1 TaxID=3138072 RepID=UPI00311E6B75
MKKISALILALVVAVAPLTGCGTQTATNETPGTSTPAVQDKSADIVVIGAGGAGMTAAIQAVQDGAKNVVIVEKMPITGGNSVRSTGGLNAAPTKYQERDGIKDSVELFVEDTMKGGKNLNDEALVRTLVENSPAAVDWVNDIGGDLSVVGMFGGASVKRIHRPSDTSAVGPMLVTALNNKVEELKIPVLLNTKADEILIDEKGAVTGVKVSGEEGSYTINTKAVVLATGGFGANAEMVTKYKPALEGFATTNHKGATGDGILMAEKIGADFVDMDQIQTHPTVNPDDQTMYTEGVRGNGAILVNKEGKRFINELETRDVVSEAILKQTDGQAYLLFDQEVRESLKAIEAYIKGGIIFEADTIEGLAEQIGVDAAALKETMGKYAGYQASGNDPDFGRDSMEFPLTKAKYYAGLCAPAVHHTMGGVKINTDAQVINKDGSPIPGLFAGGEITGGVHGGNRLGGNAVADIVIFGRIAGSGAHAYVMENGGTTEPTIQAVAKPAEAKPEVEANYKDGTYTGVGQGKGGDINVEVVVKDGEVVEINLKEHAETEGIFENAEEGVVGDIIRKQVTEVDAVGGATMTSEGIKEAVAQALQAAK